MVDIKTIVTASILGLAGLLGLVGALKGRSRGIKRQTVRTITVVLSAVLSFFAVKVFYGVITGFFESATMNDIFLKLEGFGLELDANAKDALSGFDPVIFEYILALPLALVIGPVAFVPVFVVVSAVMLIIHAILCGILGFRKKENTKFTRFLGMLLGLVQGVAVSVILLSPVLGLANLFSDTVETVRAKEDLSEAEQTIIEFYDENLNETFNSKTVRVFTDFGGKYIYSSLATIKLGGAKVDVTQEIDTVLSVYTDISSIKSDFTSLSQEEQAAVENIINTIGNSDYFAPLLATLVNNSASIIGDELLSDAEEPTKSVMVDLIDVFKNATRDTVREDVETVCDFLFLLINDGVFEATNAPEGSETTDIATVLLKADESGATTVDKAIAILDKNPRTQVIVESLVKITLVYAKETLLETFDSTGLSAEEIDKIYTDVKGSINEIVEIKADDYSTKEEYKAAVADSVEKMAIDNGFISEAELSENREKADEVFAEVSEHITENFGGKESVSDAELMNIIIEYYNSYNNKELPLP